VTGRLRVTIAAAFATLTAAASLHEVFRGYGWVAPVGGGVLVVFAAAEAVRVSRLPDALAPIGSAVATTLYLTALYARTPGRDGLLPTRATFGVLRHIANIGFDQSSSLATPVPTHRGLVLLAVAGVATIAVIVDLVAVTMRRAAPEFRCWPSSPSPPPSRNTGPACWASQSQRSATSPCCSPTRGSGSAGGAGRSWR
jgi:hypothetical protein